MSRVLQKIRNHFDKAVTITSAYRTPGHNKAVGGTTYSQHLYGKAADIKIQGIVPRDVAKYAETLLDEGGITLTANRLLLLWKRRRKSAVHPLWVTRFMRIKSHFKGALRRSFCCLLWLKYVL